MTEDEKIKIQERVMLNFLASVASGAIGKENPELLSTSQIFRQTNRYKGFYNLLEHYYAFEPDFSFAAANVTGLANNELFFEFTGEIPQRVQKRIFQEIELLKRKINKGSGGLYVFINELLRNVITTGGASVEAEIENIITDGVKNILIIPLDNINIYKEEGYVYKQMQSGKEVELNPNTYTLVPMMPDKYGYPIPPFLPALSAIKNDDTMMTSLAHVIEKFGLFGLTQVLYEIPDVLDGESQDMYAGRLMKFLSDNYQNISKNLKSGIVMGYKGQVEFKTDGSPQNVAGAESVLQANDIRKASGLKQNPAMLGRQFSVSEAIGRVFLELLQSQATAYQKVMSEAIIFITRLHLQLRGFGQYTDYVECYFKLPSITDELKDEQAIEQKILNAIMARNEGFISQDEAAQRAIGKDAAFLQEPPSKTNPTQNNE